MALESITKHPDLWFEDGKVVLIAENTGFRVYRGLLAKYSDIFRDMFSIPQPSHSAQDMFEDFPVVRLADDRAEDVATILGILFESGQSFYKESQRVPFRTVAAALHLGTKYSIEAIREEALRRISICFPSELKDLQKHDNDGYFKCLSNPCPIIWDKTDPIAVFHFARRLNLNDLIPSAIYRCALDVPIPQLFAALKNPGASYYALSLEEIEDCMVAREYLFTRNIAHLEIFSDNLSPDCTHRGTIELSPCQMASLEMASEVIQGGFVCGCDTFNSTTQWITSHEDTEAENSLCAGCASYYVQEYTAKQEEVWAELRSRFGSKTNGSAGDILMSGHDAASE